MNWFRPIFSPMVDAHRIALKAEEERIEAEAQRVEAERFAEHIARHDAKLREQRIIQSIERCDQKNAGFA